MLCLLRRILKAHCPREAGTTHASLRLREPQDIAHFFSTRFLSCSTRFCFVHVSHDDLSLSKLLPSNQPSAVEAQMKARRNKTQFLSRVVSECTFPPVVFFQLTLWLFQWSGTIQNRQKWPWGSLSEVQTALGYSTKRPHPMSSNRPSAVKTYFHKLPQQQTCALVRFSLIEIIQIFSSSKSNIDYFMLHNHRMVVRHARVCTDFFGSIKHIR